MSKATVRVTYHGDRPEPKRQRNFVAEFFATKPGDERLALIREIQAQPDHERIKKLIWETIELANAEVGHRE